ncbi:SDR family NAD(P)-dependent oxidoreductase [Marinobacter halodurans]|uniref:SDR family NAD(P)-dependent oxidoreductase n=1 Tax=Marinobacter halodurans TaxID=2528979 RepID=A0ABY1ZKL5_9GAMM|nr:SDR family NAD(P)-dependent oxidoreductase [Marinobacter halodurans]TBW56041.1 SDR family NAD(P)-dependent oxidoreductase [Marinobacter halodurans]
MSHSTLDRPITLWLTGATSGIGRALAQALLEQGQRVIATGRRRESLETLAASYPGQVTVAPADTTDRETLGALSETFTRQAPVQMAILNAGTCEYLDVRSFDADVIEHNLHTNVTGTARSMEAVLPALRHARRQGLPAELVIVGSSAWWFPFGRAEGYGASKAALAYLAHSLRADLAAEGIRVTLVSPGFVRTPLTDRNDFPMPCLIEATEAADRIIRGLHRGAAEIHFPRRFTVTLKLLGALPQSWMDRLAARMTRSSKEHPE